LGKHLIPLMDAVFLHGATVETSISVTPQGVVLGRVFDC
jgi:hypothetical protein